MNFNKLWKTVKMANSTGSPQNNNIYELQSSGQMSYVTNQNISDISVKNVKRNNIKMILS